jgi:hypothetical protein
MPEDLQTIYNRGQRRPAGPFIWYKQPTEGATCPPQDSMISVKESYDNSFQCTNRDSVEGKKQKMKEAKLCASERMADMYVLLKSGHTIHKPHVYPIKLAYGLGKQCATSETDAIDYDKDFEFWYNQLRQYGPPQLMNSVFQKGNPSPQTHPLLGSHLAHNYRQPPIPRQISRPSIITTNNGWQQVSRQRSTGTGAAASANTALNKTRRRGGKRKNCAFTYKHKRTRRHKN